MNAERGHKGTHLACPSPRAAWKAEPGAHPLRIPAGQPGLCDPPPPGRADHGEFSITTTSWKTPYLSRQLQNTPDNCYRKPARPTPTSHFPSLQDPPSSWSRLHSWLPAALLSPHWC